MATCWSWTVLFNLLLYPVRRFRFCIAWFVCKQNYLESCGWIFVKFSEELGHGARNSGFWTWERYWEILHVWAYIAGMSNLFNRRAKCTNFKLVGARQPRCRDRDAEGVEGEGMCVSPPQPTALPSWSRQKRVLTYYRLQNRAWKNTPDRHKSIIFDISAAYTHNQ